MPLTEKVVFKVMLQKENRFRVPKLVRLRYKIEPNEVLKVTVSVTSLWGGPQSFLAKGRKDGRILVPKLIIALLKRDKPGLCIEGYSMQVTLESS